MTVWRVTAKHFVAAVVEDDHGVIVECAPIVTKVVRKLKFDFKEFKKYCLNRAWELEKVG